MRIVGRLLPSLALVMMVLPAAAQSPAQAPAPAPMPAPPRAPETGGPAYVVTFLETSPASAQQAAALLRQLVAAGRKEAGTAGYFALRETARPGRFALVEAWRDKAAAEAHDMAAKALTARLAPLLISPPDRRPCVGLDVAAPAGAEGAVYVLTHVDVVPPAKDQAIGLVKTLAAASRKDAGDARFDVLQQASRANHLFLFETWRNEAARDTHISAEHTRSFRAKLLPLEGALYDERLYGAIR